MIELLVFVAWTAVIWSVAYRVGHANGYELGLDRAAQLIFGMPVVWP